MKPALRGGSGGMLPARLGTGFDRREWRAKGLGRSLAGKRSVAAAAITLS